VKEAPLSLKTMLGRELMLLQSELTVPMAAAKLLTESVGPMIKEVPVSTMQLQLEKNPLQSPWSCPFTKTPYKPVCQ